MYRQRIICKVFQMFLFSPRQWGRPSAREAEPSGYWPCLRSPSFHRPPRSCASPRWKRLSGQTDKWQSISRLCLNSELGFQELGPPLHIPTWGSSFQGVTSQDVQICTSSLSLSRDAERGSSWARSGGRIRAKRYLPFSTCGSSALRQDGSVALQREEHTGQTPCRRPAPTDCHKFCKQVATRL